LVKAVEFRGASALELRPKGSGAREKAVKSGSRRDVTPLCHRRLRLTSILSEGSPSRGAPVTAFSVSSLRHSRIRLGSRRHTGIAAEKRLGGATADAAMASAMSGSDCVPVENSGVLGVVASEASGATTPHEGL
jgi:hypothetical protein